MSILDDLLRRIVNGGDGPDGIDGNQSTTVTGNGNNTMPFMLGGSNLNPFAERIVPDSSKGSPSKGTGFVDPRYDKRYRNTRWWAYQNWVRPGLWGPSAKEDSLMFTEPVLRAAGKWAPGGGGQNIGAAGSQGQGMLPARGGGTTPKSAPENIPIGITEFPEIPYEGPETVTRPPAPPPQVPLDGPPGIDGLGDADTDEPSAEDMKVGPFETLPDIPGKKFVPGDVAPYSWVPAALGGLAGLASAMGKDPVFDRHQTSQYWRDDFKREFSGISKDARTDPYHGDYFRNANRAAITAAELAAKENANMQARQARVSGNLFGSGTERFWSKMAPGFYANQGNLLSEGYRIRDRAASAENRYTNWNTDRQQQLFQFEVANKTHSAYNRGANLFAKGLGSAMAGASAFDNIYSKLWERDLMSKMYGKALGRWEDEDGGGMTRGDIEEALGKKSGDMWYEGGKNTGPMTEEASKSFNPWDWKQYGRQAPHRQQVPITDPNEPYEPLGDASVPFLDGGTLAIEPDENADWTFAGIPRQFHGIMPWQTDEYGQMHMPKAKSIPPRTSTIKYGPIGFGQYERYMGGDGQPADPKGKPKQEMNFFRLPMGQGRGLGYMAMPKYLDAERLGEEFGDWDKMKGAVINAGQSLMWPWARNGRLF